MRRRIYLLCAILITSLILSACQAAPDESEGANRGPEQGADQEETGIETAYPIEDQALPESPALDTAYPISEEDLEHMVKTWENFQYLEDGVLQEPEVLVLQFNQDGSYEMTTASDTSRGNWTTRFTSQESSLILNSETGETRTYEIIELEEDLLIFQSWRESVQVEQRFQPVE